MERIRDVREIAQHSGAELGAEGFFESITWLPCVTFIFFYVTKLLEGFPPPPF